MVAMALALAYPIAVVAGPGALAGVTVAAAVSACALALVRRPSPRLRTALAAIALWLAAGLGGALVLRGHALRGAAWVLLALYLLPLPAIPYLYAKTFDRPEDEGKGQRAKGKGTEDVPHDARRRMSSLSLLPFSLCLLRFKHSPPKPSTPEPPRDPEGAR